MGLQSMIQQQVQSARMLAIAAECAAAAGAKAGAENA
jgi:hypothetical protein